MPQKYRILQEETERTESDLIQSSSSTTGLFRGLSGAAQPQARVRNHSDHQNFLTGRWR